MDKKEDNNISILLIVVLVLGFMFIKNYKTVDIDVKPDVPVNPLPLPDVPFPNPLPEPAPTPDGTIPDGVIPDVELEPSVDTEKEVSKEITGYYEWRTGYKTQRYGLFGRRTVKVPYKYKVLVRG